MVIAIHTKPIEFSFICSLGLIILLYHVTLYIFLDKNCNIDFINLRDDFQNMAGLVKKYHLIMLIHINLIIFVDIFDSIFLVKDLESLLLLKISPEIIAKKVVAFYHKTMLLNKYYHE
jgi:hypothetical protein